MGYTILNDINARDIQLATSQWTLGKSFDTFAPIGPSIVTADEIGDPHTPDIKLSINEEVLHYFSTKHMIFKLPDLIAYISANVPLEPGDLISTGTPAVGWIWATAATLVEARRHNRCHIQGIGELRKQVVASSQAQSGSSHSDWAAASHLALKYTFMTEAPCESAFY